VSRLPHPSLTTVLLVVATIAIGYLAITTTRYLVHNYQLRGQESQMRVQLHQLDQDHAQLIAVRDYLKSDEYVEQVARDVLGLVHPGEMLVVVSQAATVATATPSADGETTPGEPWWKELFLQPTPAPTPSH
jgi:cell division protein FtsB